MSLLDPFNRGHWYSHINSFWVSFSLLHQLQIVNWVIRFWSTKLNQRDKFLLHPTGYMIHMMKIFLIYLSYLLIENIQRRIISFSFSLSVWVTCPHICHWFVFFCSSMNWRLLYQFLLFLTFYVIYIFLLRLFYLLIDNTEIQTSIHSLSSTLYRLRLLIGFTFFFASLSQSCASVRCEDMAWINFIRFRNSLEFGNHTSNIKSCFCGNRSRGLIVYQIWSDILKNLLIVYPIAHFYS
jgi:hypothetical protein